MMKIFVLFKLKIFDHKILYEAVMAQKHKRGTINANFCGFDSHAENDIYNILISPL